jgi:branched-chain amino acid aminotransferase
MSVSTTSLQPSVVDYLERVASHAKIFVSMPYVSGITPRVLLERGIRENNQHDDQERFHGAFRMDEIGLPAFDHGVLYGDAVFEGVLIVGQGLFQWREHLERLYASAARLQIELPYGPHELTERIIETIRGASLPQKTPAYVRLVLTRGFGDLGIHPAKCAGGTIYAIVSTVQLYPETAYRQGIHLSLSRKIRRAGANILDPQIKSCNYLNNVMALLETLPEGCHETVMLTPDGFIAEATADNVFSVVREAGWENDPSKVTLFTPAANYCLKGITRGLIIVHARKLGFKVVESSTMLPQDIIGPEREVFLTGTAAGVVPVTCIDSQQVGDGRPGPVTGKLHNLLLADMEDPGMALAVFAGMDEINAYLEPGSFDPQGQTLQNVSPALNPIIRLFETIDSRNWDGLKEAFCEDATYERPGYEPLVGLERITHFYREERVIVSGKHFLENTVLNEDGGACWGRFMGIHKNNSALDERFADVYLWKNGKIWSRKSYFFRPAV